MVGAPEGFRLISLLAIGHPAEKPEKEKRTLSEVLHWEKF
jgi:nitroreductase